MEMEVCGEDTVLGELLKHLKDLFQHQLSDFNMQVKHAKLQLLHRGSFHLLLRCPDAEEAPVVDSVSMKLALQEARSHVRLLLHLMDFLLEEICHSCHLLQSFLLQYDNHVGLDHVGLDHVGLDHVGLDHVGLDHVGLDQEQLSSVLTSLRHLPQQLHDYDHRDQISLGPFSLVTQLVLPTERQVQIRASLVYRLPVEFERLRCAAKASGVQLAWGVAGGGAGDEEAQMYEVTVKSLHPSMDEHGPYEQYTVLGMELCVEPLLPDRRYQFTVKRLEGTGLVLREWVDEITMTTTAL